MVSDGDDDPFRPLAPRTQHHVQELEQVMAFPDRMVIDLPPRGDGDFDVYQINYPARVLEQVGFLEKVERVFLGPGDSDVAAKIGLAFVRHCRACCRHRHDRPRRPAALPGAGADETAMSTRMTKGAV
jgi:hypothetical protein